MAPATAAPNGARPVLVALLAAIDAGLAADRADRLLAAFGSLAAAVAAPRRELVAIVGAAAADLVVAHRLATRFALREVAVRGPIVSTRYELLDYCRHAMAHDRHEGLRVFFLNLRRELIAEEVVARGGPDHVAVEPRRIILRALELGATGLILVHNHPSGDPAPSDADRRFTQRLANAAACLDIRLHDHLVVARDGDDRIVPLAGE